MTSQILPDFAKRLLSNIERALTSRDVPAVGRWPCRPGPLSLIVDISRASMGSSQWTSQRPDTMDMVRVFK
jgi:hypothetical protein